MNSDFFSSGNLMNSNCISFSLSLPFLPPTLLIYKVQKCGRKDWKVGSYKA